jgi:hypothetical protein
MASAKRAVALTNPIPGLSAFAYLWFIVSAVVCAVDATFVVMRPWSLTAAGQPWATWQHYATFDKRYANMSDAWVVLQSYLNFAEIAIQLIVVLLGLLGRNGAAHRLAMVVSTMTLWKTAIYFGMEYLEGSVYTKHNSMEDLMLMFVVPSSFWVTVPLFLISRSWSCLAKGEEILYERKPKSS